MNGHTFNVWFARVGSALVTLGALLGSSVHLALMAQAHGVDPFWGPPLALDAMALVAGAVRRVRRDDKLALWLLAGPVALSTALQVSDHWQGHQGDLIGAAMAGAPPLAAWGVFELFLRAVDAAPEATEHAAEAAHESAGESTGRVPDTATATAPESAPTEHASTVSPSASPSAVSGAPERTEAAPERVPASAPERVPERARSKAAPEAMPVLIKRAEKLAKARGVLASELSQRVLRAELNIGSPRARELAQELARPQLELVGQQ